MNLYLISQKVNTGYDTYDSAVVAAENEDQASKINPGGFRKWSEVYDSWMFLFSDGKEEPDGDETWCKPSDVTVYCIGQTNIYTTPQVICASFNAG